MRKAVKQIAVCAGLLLIFCLVCRLTVFRTYTAYIPLGERQEAEFRREGIQVEVERPEVLKAGEPEIRDGYLRIRLKPEGPGRTDVTFRTKDGESDALQVLRVGPLHTVYDMNSGGFSGDSAVLIALTVFWALVGAIMIWHFRQARGTGFYAYGTIYYAGFGIFALATALTMLQVTVSHLMSPATYPMLSAYSTINGASMQFMMLTMPAMVLFALAMSVSNIVLLRHERLGIQNVLGLIAGLILLLGEGIGLFLFSRDFAGSEWQGRVDSTLQNTYATVFAYFECVLTGAAICTVKAAGHEPEPNQDYIVILGCWFRPDGSLPPLLRGRADRALAFWRHQKETTGKEAVFIPSGGQGRDEPMAEAEAIRRYLAAQGIPDRLILPEDRAVNTFQNMAFSRKIMEEQARPTDAGAADAVRNGDESQRIMEEGAQQTHPEPFRAIYATTNYHVFRSGVWAAEAGLKAEGIGSRTRWWFWPNAFLRETVGLLQKRWKQELLFLMVMIGFFALLSMVV